jgi:hypothetical protein
VGAAGPDMQFGRSSVSPETRAEFNAFIPEHFGGVDVDVGWGRCVGAGAA